MPTSQIRGINVINAQSVELYLEDPTAPKYTWQLSTSTPTIPRCSCDVSATTFDCGNGTISAHTDPYCVDVADNSNDNTYPGPGGGPNTNTPLPVVFYAYIGPYSSLQTSTTAVPGFIAKQARVGVNTLTPQAAFDVVGNVRFASYA